MLTSTMTDVLLTNQHANNHGSRLRTNRFSSEEEEEEEAISSSKRNNAAFFFLSIGYDVSFGVNQENIADLLPDPW